MGLRQRQLRVTADSGPRKQTTLRGLARGKDDFDTTFQRMLDSGELVVYGSKRGTKYGVPKAKRVPM